MEKYDIISIEEESQYLYKILLPHEKMPAHLPSIYSDTLKQMRLSDDKYFQIKLNNCIKRRLPLADMELALRKKTHTNPLTTRFMILSYLAELSYEAQAHYDPGPGRHWLLVSITGTMYALAMLFKLLRGEWYVRRYLS